MCKSNLQIQFCSCELNKSKERKIEPELEKVAYHQKQFIWSLKKYVGKKHTGMLGQMVMPVEGLNEDLTADYLLWQLNNKNLFDFEYTLAEGDHLEVRQDYVFSYVTGHARPELYEYLSFIFQNGKWKEDVYDIFSNKTKKFKKGFLKIEVKI